MTLTKEIRNNPYQKFVTYLTKTYPIKKTKIEVRLVGDPHIDYKTPDGVMKAAATFCVKNKDTALVKIAIGDPKLTLENHLFSLAHEFRHAHQYFVHKMVFDTAVDKKKELDADLFARRVVKEYLKLTYNN